MRNIFSTGNFLKKVKLLLVEDEPDIRESMSRYLKRRAGDVLTANDGEQGLALYRSESPDIIITDIQMPVKTGLEMAREIRKFNPDIPIFIATAFNDEKFFLEAIDIGIDKYFKKPINNTDLIHALEKMATTVYQQKQLEGRDYFVSIILDSSPNFIMITDGKAVTYLNRTFLDYLGFADFEDFNHHHSTIDNFLIEREHGFYNNKEFSEWMHEMLEHPEERFIVDMKSGRPGSTVHSYVVQLNAIPEDLNYLVTFTDVSKLDNERRAYKELAVRDPLTKIYNRQKFDEEIAREIERAERYDRDLSIIMFDIDFFKQVNDNYGHQMGDKVLQELVAMVEVSIRKTDILARYGGEEFVIIAPETDINLARDLAERLREKLQNRNFAIHESVTCSFGVAGFGENDDAYDLINKADRALYAAKHQGRNRVMLFDESQTFSHLHLKDEPNG